MYLGDYLLDSDQNDSPNNLAKIQDAWSHLSTDLASYRSATVDEQRQVKRLGDLLEQHWKYVRRAITSSTSDRSAASFYNDEVLPISASVVEITTQLESIDAKQAASSEIQIEGDFERRGARLSMVLSVGLGAALLLAAGCLLYIFRIERQNRRRYQEVLKARGALEQLSAKLVDAQEMERRTISRELHDQVGQTLNAVLVEAANLAKRIPADDADSLRLSGQHSKVCRFKRELDSGYRPSSAAFHAGRSGSGARARVASARSIAPRWDKGQRQSRKCCGFAF